MLETWLPIIVAIVAPFVSGYLGIRVGQVRMEERHAALKTKVEDIQAEIGDRHSGMRGQLHAHHNWLGRHAGRLLRLEEQAGIPPWDDRDPK